MKKYLYLLLAVLAAPSLFCSCLNENDDDIQLSDQCYINTVTLGTMYRKVTIKDSEGLDSTYKQVVTGTYFPMTIDQRTLTIENLDSLPKGTDLSAVLITADYQTALFWRKANLSEDEDTTWNQYSSKDSLDLRQPVHLYCLAADGTAHRTYTLKVNVHQQTADSTTWNFAGIESALQTTQKARMTVWNEQLLLLTDQAVWRRPLTTEAAWEQLGAIGTMDATTLQTRADGLYVSTTEGAVLKSTDGQTWTATSYPTQAGLRLVAAGDQCLYALCDGKLLSSNGGAWTEESLDDEASNLPTDLLNSVVYTMKDGRRRALLLGRKADETVATVWAKEWTKGTEATAGWVYYSPNEADKRRCPAMRNLTILPYDAGLIALGGNLDEILYSRDHGITWAEHDNSELNVDEYLCQAAAGGRSLAAAVDGNQFLWVLVDGRLWRGRINRLGFLRQDR
ncbi:MAG: hypothetical protein HUK02_00530 [Bacteroidaceae bacterium]|nr:hypothetical protein [Bacteroidaceae bacterium]